MTFSRRHILLAGGALAASSLFRSDTQAHEETPVSTTAFTTLQHTPPQGPVPHGVPASLFAAALSALDRHGANVLRDRMAIVDFSAPSSEPRLHLVDLIDGSARSLLVAHGSGSDPDHSGWVERFSNQPGSNASCDGAFATMDYYIGKHGRSQRLAGLDASNSNALERAIVLHGAWYAEPSIATTRGKLGRSQGCFAVGNSFTPILFSHLGTNRLIYAAKPQGALRPLADVGDAG